MSLFETLQADRKTAFKARETVKKDILSYMIAQVKNKTIDLWRPMEDDELLKLIQKEVKVRYETITMLETASNTEEASLEKQKIAVLDAYLPTLLTEEELTAIVAEKKAALGIEDMWKQRGQLIGAIMKEYGAVVDGRLLNEILSR